MLTERRGSVGLLNVILCTKNRGSRSVNSALRSPSMLQDVKQKLIQQQNAAQDAIAKTIEAQQEREQRKAEIQKPREKIFREMWTVEQENFQTHLLRMQTAEQKAAQENRARSTKAQRERVHQRLTKHQNPSEARQGLSAEYYQQMVREVDLHNAKRKKIEQDKIMRKNPAKQEKAQHEHE